jgi:hypothetical protein
MPAAPTKRIFFAASAELCYYKFEALYMMENSECGICCETSSNNIECVCGTFCKSCCKKHILESSVDQCPGCKSVWSLQTLYKYFGNSFVNKDYRKKRLETLLNMEMALLIETQLDLINDRRRQDNDCMLILNRLLTKMQMIVQKADYNKKHYKFRTEKTDKYFKIFEDFGETITAIKAEMKTEVTTQTATAAACKKEPNRFISKCEQCVGFVSSNGVCDMCGTKYCKKCREVLSDQHTCDANSVLTVEMLVKDSKPCPSCGVLIHKINGCDQMWCTNCKTPYSWNNGTILTERIHNPHYIEYIRKNNIVDIVPCDDEIPPVYALNRFNNDFVSQFQWSLVHLRAEVRNKYRTDPINNNLARKQYLIGLISKKAFEKEIERADKKFRKNKDISDVLNTYIYAGADVLRKLILSSNLDEFHQASLALIDYVNESLHVIFKIYNSKVPRLNIVGTSIKILAF